MAGVGRQPKDDLSPEEQKAVVALLSRGSYRGSGLRAAAALVSALRKAHEASTPKAKDKRTVSARWVERQLAKCGIDASAAKLGIAQRRAKARRRTDHTVDTGPRIGCSSSPVAEGGETGGPANSASDPPAQGGVAGANGFATPVQGGPA